MSDKAPNYNYMVHVTCPHCTARLVVAVSGFGGELAVREKECRKCGREFSVHILTAVAPKEGSISDALLSSMRARIAALNRTRKETLASLLIKHEIAARIYQESLEEAQRQRAAHESN